MDLTPYIDWIVFVHVLSVFSFAAGHGVSMFVAFQIRRERNRERLEALLDLSAWSLGLAGVGMLVVLVSGILAGIVVGSWDKPWLWVSLVLFIVIGGAMTPIGGGYLRGARLALGQRTSNMKASDPDPVPVSDAELDKILESKRPEMLLAIGAGGFVVILWLMMFKP